MHYVSGDSMSRKRISSLLLQRCAYLPISLPILPYRLLISGAQEESGRKYVGEQTLFVGFPCCFVHFRCPIIFLCSLSYPKDKPHVEGTSWCRPNGMAMFRVQLVRCDIGIWIAIDFRSSLLQRGKCQIHVDFHIPFWDNSTFIWKTR